VQAAKVSVQPKSQQDRERYSTLRASHSTPHYHSKRLRALKFDHISYPALRCYAISNSGKSHAGFGACIADLLITMARRPLLTLAPNDGIERKALHCGNDSNSRLRMTRHGW